MFLTENHKNLFINLTFFIIYSYFMFFLTKFYTFNDQPLFILIFFIKIHVKILIFIKHLSILYLIFTEMMTFHANHA